MIITPDTLKALFTGFKKNFQDGLQMADSQYKEIATVIPSSTASNTYGWLGQWPAFREWVGDRVFQDMKAHGYAITNKHFESSVKVNRNDIEDDNVGIYAPMMTEMGRASAVHPDELVFALLKNAHATLCYDGQNFFDNDHPVYEKVDGTGRTTTVSNMFDGVYTAWYLLDTSRALKPLIYQERKPKQFTAMTAATDEGVFMRNEYRYGVDGRCNVGLGFWQMAAKSEENLDAAGFEKAYNAMVSLKGDGGRPLGIRPNVLLVPPSLENAAKKLVEGDRLDSGAYNPNKGKCKVIVSPWLL